MGVYLGVTDTFYCTICTPEECWNEENNCYEYITYLENYSRNAEKFPTDMWEDVEIYSDYGGGFFWKGKGNEERRVIDSHSCTVPCYDFDKVFDGVPDWAQKFMDKIFKEEYI